MYCVVLTHTWNWIQYYKFTGHHMYFYPNITLCQLSQSQFGNGSLYVGIVKRVYLKGNSQDFIGKVFVCTIRKMFGRYCLVKVCGMTNDLRTNTNECLAIEPFKVAADLASSMLKYVYGLFEWQWRSNFVYTGSRKISQRFYDHHSHSNVESNLLMCVFWCASTTINRCLFICLDELPYNILVCHPPKEQQWHVQALIHGLTITIFTHLADEQ